MLSLVIDVINDSDFILTLSFCFFILLNVVGVDYQHTRSCVLLLVILTNQIQFTSLCIWQITMLFGTPVRYLRHTNYCPFFTLVVLWTTVVIFSTGFGFKYSRNSRTRPPKSAKIQWSLIRGGCLLEMLGSCNKQCFLFQLFYFLMSFVLGCSFRILIYSSTLQRAAGTLPSQNHSKAVQVNF